MWGSEGALAIPCGKFEPEAVQRNEGLAGLATMLVVVRLQPEASAVGIEVGVFCFGGAVGCCERIGLAGSSVGMETGGKLVDLIQLGGAACDKERSVG